MESGDSLFMFTDGVTEAINVSYEEFGEQRLYDILSSVADKNSEQIVDAVKASVALFVGEAEQSDDITMLVLKRK